MHHFTQLATQFIANTLLERLYELSSLQRTTKHIHKLYYPDQCTMIIIHENYLAWMCGQMWTENSAFFQPLPSHCSWYSSSKTTMSSSHIHTLLLSLPFSLSGGHGVSFAPSGDDNHCANWRPVGRLPENPQPDDHHQCQEAHELWRWECQKKKGRPVHESGSSHKGDWKWLKLLPFGLKVLSDRHESVIFFCFLIQKMLMPSKLNIHLHPTAGYI